MTKTQHLQFLVLMIPTFVILAAAVVSMADLREPTNELYAATGYEPEVYAVE
jgi:hypothetical protein